MSPSHVVLRMTNEFSNIRPYASDPIVVKLDGPAELIGGDIPSRWLLALGQSGLVRRRVEQ
jgi:beta-galactosidase